MAQFFNSCMRDCFGGCSMVTEVVLNHHFPERFFNCVGSSGVVETICNSAGMRALEYVYGTCHGQDPEIIPDLDLLVTWGANPAWTNPHGFALIRKMQGKGGRHVVIDPVRTATALRGEHLAINPGTDWYLAMGVINLLIRDGSVDREYVSGRTVGYDNLCDLAGTYTSERVSCVTGLAAGQVTALGMAFAKSRNFLIHIGWGFQRRMWAGHGVRAISFIPALLLPPLSWVQRQGSAASGGICQ